MTGITCNAICPGWVLTPLVQKQVETRAARERIRTRRRKKRAARREAAVDAVRDGGAVGAAGRLPVLGRCSEVRGVAWNVDGGWVAQ